MRGSCRAWLDSRHGAITQAVGISGTMLQALLRDLTWQRPKAQVTRSFAGFAQKFSPYTGRPNTAQS